MRPAGHKVCLQRLQSARRMHWHVKDSSSLPPDHSASLCQGFIWRRFESCLSMTIDLCIAMQTATRTALQQTG